MIEPANGSEVIVYVDPEYDDDPEGEIVFKRDDSVDREHTPVNSLTLPDIDDARWVDQEDIWEHPLSWDGMTRIPGYRRRALL